MERISLSLRGRILVILERMKRPCTRGELMSLGCHRSKRGETAVDVQMNLDELHREGVIRLVRPFQSLRGPSARIAWELNEELETEKSIDESDDESFDDEPSEVASVPELIPPPGCQWETGIVLVIPEYREWNEVEKVLKVIPSHSTQPLAGWRDPTVSRTSYTEQGNTFFAISRHGQKMRNNRMERIKRNQSQ